MDQDVVALLRSIHSDVERIAAAMSRTPQPIDSTRSYNRQQTAHLMGVSVWTVDRARRDGQLVETERIGERDVRITGASILRFHRHSESRRQILKL